MKKKIFGNSFLLFVTFLANFILVIVNVIANHEAINSQVIVILLVVKSEKIEEECFFLFFCRRKLKHCRKNKAVKWKENRYPGN